MIVLTYENYGIKQTNKKTYSIDYLIGEENYLNKGYEKEIIRQLIEKVKTEGGKEIIVQPDMENVRSNKIILANGFEYNENKKYYYKELQVKYKTWQTAYNKRYTLRRRSAAPGFGRLGHGYAIPTPPSPTFCQPWSCFASPYPGWQTVVYNHTLYDILP